jgi:hypothetical protein
MILPLLGRAYPVSTTSETMFHGTRKSTSTVKLAPEPRALAHGRGVREHTTLEAVSRTDGIVTLGTAEGRSTGPFMSSYPL